MPHCPQCQRRFSSKRGVIAHQSQPHGACRLYFTELVTIAEAVRQSHQQEPSQDHQQSQNVHANNLAQDPTPPPFDHEGFDEAPSVELNSGATEIHPHLTKDVYPDSGTIREQGPTFMDVFNQDTFSEQRKGNLYYPFASRDEWDLASFLLQSNLSMAMIDRFLSLKIVSPCYQYWASSLRF